jgi:hypothetical protein
MIGIGISCLSGIGYLYERDRGSLFDRDRPVLYERDRVSCVSGIGMSCMSRIGMSCMSGIRVSCYLYYPLLFLQYWICQSQGQKVSGFSIGVRNHRGRETSGSETSGSGNIYLRFVMSAEQWSSLLYSILDLLGGDWWWFHGSSKWLRLGSYIHYDTLALNSFSLPNDVRWVLDYKMWWVD